MLLEDNGTLDEQHSAARTVVLHLLPGALITAFYAGAAPVVRSLGFPSLMAIFLAIAFVLILFELGYLTSLCCSCSRGYSVPAQVS
jgi:hypothetical protein